MCKVFENKMGMVCESVIQEDPRDVHRILRDPKHLRKVQRFRTLTEVQEDLGNIIEDLERSKTSIKVPVDPNILKIKVS